MMVGLRRQEKEDDMYDNSKQHDAIIVDLNEEKNAITLKVRICCPPNHPQAIFYPSSYLASGTKQM